MKTLFICKGNMYRSQMAAALYNKLTNTTDAFSVGTYPGAPEEPEGQFLKDLPPQGLLSEYFLSMMKEKGMDLYMNTTKRLTPEMLSEYDIVVSMAEEPFIPDFLREDKSVIWWDVENPTESSKEITDATYTKINNLVTELIHTYAHHLS